MSKAERILEELYDGKEEDITIGVQEWEPHPLKEEINHALLKLAQRKAPGPDDITIELLRFGGEMTLNKLHESCTCLLYTSPSPRD